jgi:LAO/AO transport system kinase
MLLCEAAGFDVILIETVGVGQSETAVADMVDLFMLLLLPGGGDELQGIKKGIVELADLVVVNKADGDLVMPARLAVAEYQHALMLLRPATGDWKTPVLSCSARTGTGIDEVWQTITRYRDSQGAAGTLAARRAEQAASWLWNEIRESLVDQFRAHPTIRALLPDLEARVRRGDLPPTKAAMALLGPFLAGGQQPD